jgi:hypothetical protein
MGFIEAHPVFFLVTGAVTFSLFLWLAARHGRFQREQERHDREVENEKNLARHEREQQLRTDESTREKQRSVALARDLVRRFRQVGIPAANTDEHCGLDGLQLDPQGHARCMYCQTSKPYAKALAWDMLPSGQGCIHDLGKLCLVCGNLERPSPKKYRCLGDRASHSHYVDVEKNDMPSGMFTQLLDDMFSVYDLLLWLEWHAALIRGTPIPVLRPHFAYFDERYGRFLEIGALSAPLPAEAPLPTPPTMAPDEGAQSEHEQMSSTSAEASPPLPRTTVDETEAMRPVQELQALREHGQSVQQEIDRRTALLSGAVAAELVVDPSFPIQLPDDKKK